MIRLQLPDGESCEGDWTRVKPETLLGKPAGTVPPGSLSTAWDSVDGIGHYKAHALGSQQHGQATRKGKRGTTLSFEAYRDTIKGSPRLAVALDNQGNLYKVAL